MGDLKFKLLCDIGFIYFIAFYYVMGVLWFVIDDDFLCEGVERREHDERLADTLSFV